MAGRSTSSGAIAFFRPNVRSSIRHLYHVGRGPRRSETHRRRGSTPSERHSNHGSYGMERPSRLSAGPHGGRRGKPSKRRIKNSMTSEFEYWSIGVLGLKHRSITPLFQSLFFHRQFLGIPVEHSSFKIGNLLKAETGQDRGGRRASHSSSTNRDHVLILILFQFFRP